MWFYHKQIYDEHLTILSTVIWGIFCVEMYLCVIFSGLQIFYVVLGREQKFYSHSFNYYMCRKNFECLICIVLGNSEKI